MHLAGNLEMFCVLCKELSVYSLCSRICCFGGEQGCVNNAVLGVGSSEVHEC